MSRATSSNIIDWHRVVEILSELMPDGTKSIHASEHAIRMLAREEVLSLEDAFSPSNGKLRGRMWDRAVYMDDLPDYQVKFFNCYGDPLGIVIFDSRMGKLFSEQEYVAHTSALHNGLSTEP